MRIKRYLLRAVLVLAAAVFFLTGCAQKKEQESTQDSRKYTVYYCSLDGNSLVGKDFTPDKEDFSGIVDELIESFCNPSEDDVVSALPDGVELKGYSLNVDSLTVDFDGAYLSLSNIKEVLLRAAIVRTLIQMPGIYYVSITADGQPVKEADGTVIGQMNEDSFVESQGSGINSYHRISLNLFFSTTDGKKVSAETQEVFCSSNLITERVIVEQIIAGPDSDDLIRVTSPDVSVNSVTVTNKICVIDLDENFNQVYNENLLPETCLYAFVNSICEACDVDGVQFRIDGEENIRFLGEISLDQTFTQNDDIIAAPSEEKGES